MLGKYNPLPDATGTKHVERTKYWLSVSAQPSDPARKLLEKAGLLPPKPAPWRDMGSVTLEQSIASLLNNKTTAPSSSNIPSASVRNLEIIYPDQDNMQDQVPRYNRLISTFETLYDTPLALVARAPGRET
ncbi:37S ribosomal protein S16, mitochondrial [Dispira simplex]|nr:37S ribosomal protein S16, mitochondrial [Dispira simplex]